MASRSRTCTTASQIGMNSCLNGLSSDSESGSPSTVLMAEKGAENAIGAP